MSEVKRVCHEPWLNFDSYRGSIFLDVGANNGDWTFNLAPRFQRVIAIEPQPAPLAELLAWRNEHRVWNVAAVAVAVGRQSRLNTHKLMRMQLNLTQPHQSLLAAEPRRDWPPEQFGGELLVPVMPLSAMLPFLSLSEEDFNRDMFIKVDVEGDEVEFLQGLPRLQEGNLPRLLLEIHSELNGYVVRDTLLEQGYLLTTVRHPRYEPESENWRQHYWIKAE